ncbi:MAG: DNA/RNA non-specific endonuclease [Clostridia bacterium]|nr:DNA/RNA non-specific endonuclease [Clostridia bacterium]
MKRFIKNVFIILLLIISMLAASCTASPESGVSSYVKVTVPESGEKQYVPYEIYGSGKPSFTIPSPITAYEHYGELDGLGRCTVAEACLGRELMPPEDEERDSLSTVTPSGWKQAKYPDDVVDKEYLYHRCHLIGFQLSGEQANKKNLITGTSYMNTEGMLPFENMVADYIEATGNHVMYRATPHYADTFDLVARGVILEALSVEDGGEAISFCVYIHNVQPNVTINYHDGSSYIDFPGEESGNAKPEQIVINTSSKKFHLPDCDSAAKINDKNKEIREYTDGIFDVLVKEGFEPCGSCRPTG